MHVTGIKQEDSLLFLCHLQWKLVFRAQSSEDNYNGQTNK